MPHVPAHPAASPPPAAEQLGDRPLSAAARAAVAAGIPAETRRGYTGDWTRFERWAAEHGAAALPCTAETLTEYATYLTTVPRPRTGAPYAPASVDRALAAIAVAHKAAGHLPPASTGARLVLRGYEARLQETKDPRRTARRATAATPAILRRMIAATDTTTAIGARDAAVLLAGFALAARRSELRLLNWEDLAEAEAGFEVEVYRPKVTKTVPLGIPYGSHPATCPVRAIRRWRQALLDAGREPIGPLFLRIDRHGRIAAPMTRGGWPIGDPAGRITGDAIGRIVKRAAARASLTASPQRDDQAAAVLPAGTPRWSGHSLRRGFANAARQAGADPIDTARHGGWVDGSKALAAYWDEAGTWDDTNPLFSIGL